MCGEIILIFFCVTGGIDKRLISKKISGKKLFDIGHPRFDYLKSKKNFGK